MPPRSRTAPRTYLAPSAGSPTRRDRRRQAWRERSLSFHSYHSFHSCLLPFVCPLFALCLPFRLPFGLPFVLIQTVILYENMRISACRLFAHFPRFNEFIESRAHLFRCKPCLVCKFLRGCYEGAARYIYPSPPSVLPIRFKKKVNEKMRRYGVIPPFPLSNLAVEFYPSFTHTMKLLPYLFINSSLVPYFCSHDNCAICCKNLSATP